jgi:hypothetical protein
VCGGCPKICSTRIHIWMGKGRSTNRNGRMSLDGVRMLFIHPSHRQTRLDCSEFVTYLLVLRFSSCQSTVVHCWSPYARRRGSRDFYRRHVRLKVHVPIGPWLWFVEGPTDRLACCGGSLDLDLCTRRTASAIDTGSDRDKRSG